ncbi:hypothetical protein L218DRAFT_948858 [Marasmius fiardii PR-910]|nr:hypothetical protein L218DRAFT_948858 [Marasmius fiardii PR-910]
MTITSFPRSCTHSALRRTENSDASGGFSQLFSQDNSVHRRVSQHQKEQHVVQYHEHRWDQPWDGPTTLQQNSSFGVEDDCEQKSSVQLGGVLQSYPSRTSPSSSGSVHSKEKYHDQNVHHTAVEQHVNPVYPASSTQITDSRQLSSQGSVQPSGGSRVGLPPVIGIDLTTAEAESRLRRAHNLPAGFTLNLSSISDPPPPEFHQDTLVQIAIWSSPAKRLIAADIYLAIQNRFRSFPEGSDQPWRRSIRHMLSFKRAYVKSNDRDHAGRHFWELDFDHLDQGYKRKRKRGAGGLRKRLAGKARHSKLPDFELEPGVDEILVDRGFKEEHHSPSPSLMYQDEPSPPSLESDPSSATMTLARSERSRYAAGFSDTLRRPTALRARTQSSLSTTEKSPHSVLGVGDPVYLYPPQSIPDTKPLHPHGFIDPLFTFY